MKSLTLKLCTIVLLLSAVAGGSLRAQGLSYQANGSTVADMVINEAKKYIGTPYRWGGKGPGGFDCAGFTRYIYSKFGVSLSPSAAPQFREGVSVKRSELCKGDLVFYGGRKSRHSIGHVGIVTSVGDGEFFFIHASSKGVRISSSNEAYYSTRYICACRVIDKVTTNLPANESTPIVDPAIPIQVIVNNEPAAQPVENPISAVVDSLITIAMVGDMMLGTTYPSNQLPANNGKNLFDDVSAILISADIAVGNCEGAICAKGKCTKGTGKNSYAFRMPPSYASLFKDAGFDFLSLANNHSNDFGTEGIRETMRLLDEMLIKYAGVKDMCESAILKRNGITYGFCAFGHNGYTYRHQDEAQVKKILRSLRDSCDILIVSFHGGAEGKDKIHLPEGRETFLGEDRGSLRHFAHLCIDEGADIVHGHGPHVCRAMEVYKGHLIAYSLGNFCTPAGINVSGISGYAPVVVARINRKGELVSGRIHSFIQPYGTGPRLDESNKVAQFIRTLTLADIKHPHLNISDDGTFVPVK
ncbi:MAG: CapA family protein [Bacteroidales bacterium]|nr:CapA family protein [Bacteroidales bacterium]